MTLEWGVAAPLEGCVRPKADTPLCLIWHCKWPVKAGASQFAVLHPPAEPEIARDQIELGVVGRNHCADAGRPTGVIAYFEVVDRMGKLS